MHRWISSNRPIAGPVSEFAAGLTKVKSDPALPDSASPDLTTFLRGSAIIGTPLPRRVLVPDRADKFDADTLNPLLNPLLASNMGRWAEVYFTSPPEKREQAVSELLRELEDVAAPATASVHGGAGMSAKENTETADLGHLSASAFETVHTCEVCAYNNSAGHSFCGMCGTPLQVGPETDVPQDAQQDAQRDVLRDAQVAEAAPILAQSWHERSLGPDSVEETIEHAVRSGAAPEATAALEASWRRTERNLPYRGVKSDPPPHRYRLYVGAVLAIFLAAFGYAAWRGTEARSRATASSSTLVGTKTQPAPIHSAQPAGATASALPAGTQPGSAVQHQEAPVTSSPQGQGADSRTALHNVAAPAGSSAVPSSAVPAGAVAAAQNGAGELAIAEQYLNGTSGMTRDSGEAAQWLWKAVGKRNVEATLVLSDLYVRGDGVPKSCDQARLLLDAAARKGARAAAERLRQLQASGCE
jgi:hypothetical protein